MAIEVNIKKKFGGFRLDIQFTSQNNRIGILGASGCGKSITLKSIAGVEEPDEGYISVDGQVLFDSSQKINIKPQQRHIGYLFQNYALFPTQPVEQNIMAGLRGSKVQKLRRVKEMIHKFQLDGLEKRLPGELSGGQQQRVALARIMAYEPSVILLDEPFSALDVFLKDRLQQELQEMLEDYPGLVILVSHSRDEIYRFSSELLVMHEGQTICHGDTREMFANPVKKEAARLTGCKNIVPVQRVDDHTLQAEDWKMTLQREEPFPASIAYIGYRAHDFIPIWGEKIENCIPFDVRSTAELPFEKKFFLNGKGQEEICWFVQREQWCELEERGLPDYLQLDMKRILCLEENGIRCDK